jgi:hypothetical protein
MDLHRSAEPIDPTGWDPGLRRIRPPINGPIPGRAAATEHGESAEENFR